MTIERLTLALVVAGRGGKRHTGAPATPSNGAPERPAEISIRNTIDKIVRNVAAVP
jgi:hypothetical protein